MYVYLRACVCVVSARAFKSIFLSGKKESFSTKGEGTAAMSVLLIRTGHMRGEKETERGRTFERKRQGKIFDVILLSLFFSPSCTRAHTHAAQWLMSRCDADI